MSPPLSLALQYVFRDAQRLAEEVGKRPSTVHLLLHLVTFENPARTLLARHELTRTTLVRASRGAGHDAPHLMDSLRERCVELGKNFSSAETDCLHLLGLLCKTPESMAFQVLDAAGADVAALRRKVNGHLLEGPRPRGLGQTVVPAETRRERPLHSERPARRAEGARDVGGRVLARDAPAPHEEPNAAGMPRPPATTPSAAPTPTPQPDHGGFGLNPAHFPILTDLGRNLTEEAALGRLDPVIGREDDLVRVCEALGKRQSNSALLVGPPGVGKTALVEGLARTIVHAPCAG